MKKIFNKILLLLLVFVFWGSLIVSGCTSDKQSAKKHKLDSIKLTQDFAISAGTKKVLIGNFAGLAIGEENNIYVVDTELQTIYEFSYYGKYIGSFGKRGKGPGEFIDISPQIHISEDTLYALDKSMLRINLFNLESGSLIRTIKIPEAKVNGVRIGYAQNIFPLEKGNILIFFLNPYILPPKDNVPQKMITVSKLSSSGGFIKKNYIRIPTPYPTLQKIVYLNDGMFVFGNLSFFPVIEMTTNNKGNLYVAKTDSLIFYKYNTSGTLKNVVRSTHHSIKITEHYFDSLSNERGHNFDKAMDQAGRPNYWPALKSFFISDKGRIWVELIKPEKAQRVWQIYNSEGQPKWKLQLPPHVNLYEVQGAYAYGISRPDSGFASIVRYKLEAF